MPNPRRQSTPQLAVRWERTRVCVSGLFLPLSLILLPRYLYYLILGIDACFRFKRRQISSYERDPELGPGYAYLVAWDSYSDYLRRFTDQEEVCFYCSQYLALTRMINR